MKSHIHTNKKGALILCTGNSARSQMAEGILRNDGGDTFEVESAGVKPSSVPPEAIEAMREIGIDISMNRSKSVDEFVGQDFDYIITVCDNAKETCPVFPGKAERIHQNFGLFVNCREDRQILCCQEAKASSPFKSSQRRRNRLAGLGMP